MSARSKTSSSANSSATIGFEAKLLLAADKLHNNMDAAERDKSPKVTRRARREPRVKYIYDTFEEHHAKLIAKRTQSRTLATLRDTLLPKLQSGELSFNESNAVVS